MAPNVQLCAFVREMYRSMVAVAGSTYCHSSKVYKQDR